MDIVSTLSVTTMQRIDNLQGQNSLGVYSAHDPQMGGEWALKVISKAGFRNPKEFFTEAKRMFESEHPNVVSVRTASETQDNVLLLMPLYRNGSLKSRIERGPLSICKTVTIGREILAGVGAIHAGGSVHFDIKPSNVLFSDNGTAKVSDFGQARELGPNGVTLMPDRIYAPLTPPEVFTQARKGTRLSDIFQVGVTLYRTVNGESFFEDQFLAVTGRGALQDAIVRGKFPRRDKFLPHVPDRLRRCLRKAMRVDVEKRYHDSEEFANALARVLPTLDWTYRRNADESIWWEANRLKQPSLCVTKNPKGKLFEVALYTSRNGKVRATKKGFWKSNLSDKAAHEYLNQLFEALEKK